MQWRHKQAKHMQSTRLDINNATSGAACLKNTGNLMVFPRGEFIGCFRERQIILYIDSTWYKTSLKIF